MIEWNKIERGDIEKIAAIIERAEARGYFGSTAGLDRRCMFMDLTACHIAGCKLDLGALLNGSAETLAHDLCGISRHIDRSTGKLLDCFLPRTAKMEELQ